LRCKEASELSILSSSSRKAQLDQHPLSAHPFMIGTNGIKPERRCYHRNWVLPTRLATSRELTADQPRQRADIDSGALFTSHVIVSRRYLARPLPPRPTLTNKYLHLNGSLSQLFDIYHLSFASPNYTHFPSLVLNPRMAMSLYDFPYS
jgi:hypothetical protein